MNTDRGGLPQTTHCRITIDGGGGTQVFHAHSPGELIAKLADAQRNATRKIRQQATRLRALEVSVDPFDMNEAVKEALAARILANFDQAVSEFISPALIASVKERDEQRKREEERAQRQAEQDVQTCAEFAQQTPGYLATPRNTTKIGKWLELHSLPISRENLQLAFEDLNSSGLLETESRPIEPPAPTDAAESQEVQTPAGQGLLTTYSAMSNGRRKVVGGLSAKRSAPLHPPRRAQTSREIEQQAAQLTTDQLRELALQSI
jgi:hypothetical protein